MLVPFDWIIVAAYFVLVFIVALMATVRARNAQGTSAGYFLAGRHAGWFVIGASLFASNIGSEHLVGLAGAGASAGLLGLASAALRSSKRIRARLISRSSRRESRPANFPLMPSSPCRRRSRWANWRTSCIRSPKASKPIRWWPQPICST